MTVPYTFGTQSSPIPLSDLDANFAAVPNYANVAGNVLNSAQANITSVGTLISLSVAGNVHVANVNTGIVTANTVQSQGNISTNDSISALGTVTAANVVSTNTVIANTITATGLIQTTNNLIGGNIYSPGIVSVIGTIATQGNIQTSAGSVLAQGIISATGNIVTASYFVGNFKGNVTGNVSVAGSNTQILFNSNGNIGASAGLTFTTTPNVLTVLGSANVTGNITGSNINTAGSVSATGNLIIGGTGQFIGLVTAPTPIANAANNQIATTAFVNNKVGTLGTMATQNAVSVAITGGTIGNAIVTLASISVSNIANSAITATTIGSANITNSTLDRVTMVGGWSVVPSGTKLYFQYNGNNVASLDSSGNFTTTGNVTAFGTP
jgi:hypothetical protein